MQIDPNIRSRLVHILYSAMPQVASSTLGTVLLAATLWWRAPSASTMAAIVAAAIVTVIRLGILVAYRRKVGALPVAPARAMFWEILYGVFSIVMAIIFSSIMLMAFLVGDSGVQLLTIGVAIGICGGQSTARVTCRLWIPLASGTVILVTLAGCSLLWKDSLAPIFAIFALLYLDTYAEACRHSANTLLARLVAESELASLVRRDALTGLGNRLGFDEELQRAFRALQRGGGDVSLLMLDLDGFKTVNDDLGHPAGDAVLRDVAERLGRLSRQTDYLARLGGDEFAIIVTDSHDRVSLSKYAGRLIAEISERFEIEGTAVRIGVSIGIATATPAGPSDTKQLLAAADAALYRVKRSGKNDHAFGDGIEGLVQLVSLSTATTGTPPAVRAAAGRAGTALNS